MFIDDDIVHLIHSVFYEAYLLSITLQNENKLKQMLVLTHVYSNARKVLSSSLKLEINETGI